MEENKTTKEIVIKLVEVQDLLRSHIIKGNLSLEDMDFIQDHINELRDINYSPPELLKFKGKVEEI